MYVGYISDLDKKHCKKIHIYKCSECIKFFIRGYNKDYIKNKFHFCSTECCLISRSKNGEYCKLTKLRNISKFGAESYAQSEEFINNNIKNFGTRYYMQTPEFLDRIKQTCLKKHGVENISQLQENKEKVKKTCQQRYNADTFFQSQEFKDKFKLTCLKRYGVENPFQSQKIIDSYDHKLATRKAHETKKKNGTYAKSKIEDLFYEFLCLEFDSTNIERQALLTKWHIDFYIKSIDCYVQLDGIYWHGLDRTLEEIKKCKNKRDVTILHHMKTDTKQNEYCKENNLKLIRITDIEFKDKSKHQEIIDRIVNCNKKVCT